MNGIIEKLQEVTDLTRPPRLQLSKDAFDGDDKLHEELVRLFGALVMWCRDDALEFIQRHVESDTDRQRLATAFRGIYEEAATKLDSDGRQVASELNARAIGHFGKALMTVFAGTGMSLPISDQLVARFRLVVELCDKESGDVIREEVINRGGRRFFADYWNSWINSKPPQST